jgi:uncharacterized protein
MAGAHLGRATAMLVAFAAPAWPSCGQALFNVAGDSAAVRVTSLRDMPFRTVVRQQYDYSCGSAALATLLTHHYGRPTGEATIFQSMFAAGDQAKIRAVGFSLLDMKRYLESRGLKADGYRWTMADLQRAASPAIALITVGNYRHFVIIKGFRHGKVLVGDPAQGLKLYALDDFRKVWNGVVFMVDPRAGPAVAYDRPEEWKHFALGPFDPLDDTALSSFTRELPPIYQIVGFSRGGGAIR